MKVMLCLLLIHIVFIVLKWFL
uniref:Uncharacterized protein n=1 Tax=Anguilla anguilla TaxID=7936 RepID=A0A0E9SX99_ANGAN